MKVLHVDTGREWRGGQTQLLHLLRNHEGPAHVALPPDAPIREAIEATGATVHAVAFDGPLRGSRALGQVIAEVQPDVVAAHTSHAHNHALLARAGKPVVVHRRVDFKPGRLSRVKYRAADGYVAVSRAVADILVEAGVDSDRIDVVHDGVEPSPFLAEVDRARARALLGVPEDAPLIGAVGALVPHKGHIHLVEAMAWIDNKRQDVWCVIAGEGPERAALQAKIDEWGIGGRTKLLGQRDDVAQWLGALDVFAHPSVEEGMGQAVVEAALTGVPVVASSAGGIPEVIQDMQTGILTPPGDGAALSRALIAALRGRERALDRAVRARQAMQERFTPATMAQRTFEAYRRYVR